ncbi:hypothetical protein C8J56DRAFT_892724 [Mycena floridula]|nr:hypothetical protein C8J56DRAFT_892724 [Mycena floridula]
MTCCDGCGTDFPLLQLSTCHKCVKLKAASVNARKAIQTETTAVVAKLPWGLNQIDVPKINVPLRPLSLSELQSTSEERLPKKSGLPPYSNTYDRYASVDSVLVDIVTDFILSRN